MGNLYDDKAYLFKALSDSNRLRIIDMLSGGELCACRILDELNITQPTLSHHMKNLCDLGLVNARRDGKWMYYSLNNNKIQELITFLSIRITETKTPICKEDCSC